LEDEGALVHEALQMSPAAFRRLGASNQSAAEQRQGTAAGKKQKKFVCPAAPWYRELPIRLRSSAEEASCESRFLSGENA
jgi:hypothetical protein